MASLKARLLLVSLACIAMPARAAQPPSLEYAIKASYLYKFAPFVGWPPRAFADLRSPFRICVAGEDPFGPVLDQVVRGQRVDGHPVVVQRLAVTGRGMGCHILFAGRSDRQTPAEMLKAVEDEPVLTVTDKSGGINGGMIEFLMQGGRVRFSVDSAAAQASGLPISSKLLQLAVPDGR